MNPKRPALVLCSFHFEVNFPVMVIGSPIVSICAEEEHREHQQQAAAGDEERQVHPGLQDRPQDAEQLQGHRFHFFSKRCQPFLLIDPNGIIFGVVWICTSVGVCL